MILIINLCKEKLHYLEFVKPIEDILEGDFFTKYYLELTEEDFDGCDKVIICGTSLKDNSFLEDVEKFNWIKNFEKPLLGICAGFQLIGLVFGGGLKKNLEIGYFHENFDKEFLELEGDLEVYHLHNNYVKFNDDFEVFSEGKVAQAVKHKEKQIYGTLFHPEVRNREMILNFINL
ncbi:gamma-glutamyl-gamma-aminobutyrate hydrolase family protein [Candidatus Pacearchaeota archaeon]|nr:gamma-glutamyl-gamma-aminobutyrate hydrolase family protein [Candidatus Pacearchaeota archaeon]